MPRMTARNLLSVVLAEIIITTTTTITTTATRTTTRTATTVTTTTTITAATATRLMARTMSLKAVSEKAVLEAVDEAEDVSSRGTSSPSQLAR